MMQSQVGFELLSKIETRKYASIKDCKVSEVVIVSIIESLMTSPLLFQIIEYSTSTILRTK